MDDHLDQALAAVGPRLRALRRQRETTLAELSAATGISVSTLSRLESGARRPTLELLLPLATAHGVTLDELVGAPSTGDPRIHLRPVTRHGMIMLPLTRRAGGIQAYKLVIAASGQRGEPDPQTHEGYEWLYVLNGRLRLILGDQDLVLLPGEAAEFDTRVPHWFGAAGTEPVEFLSLFGSQGERAHLRARDRRAGRTRPRAAEPDRLGWVLVLRTVAVAVLSSTMLALGAFPAAAANRSVRTFGIPGVYGISAWGSYERTGTGVRVSICLEDSARGVYGGAAAGLAYEGAHRQVATAVVVGFRHTSCRTMTSRYSSHLVVDAVSGWPDRRVRQVGRVTQVY